jgi:hypothetical protein
LFDWPHENQTIGIGIAIAIAMVTGQSGKVAAEIILKTA